MKKNKFFTKALLALFLFLFSNILYAKPNDCLILHLKNGTKVVCNFSETLPKIYFDREFITISSNIFDITNVLKYTFGDSESTSIHDLLNNGAPAIKIDKNGGVTINSKSKKTDIKIYNVDGKLYATDIKPISTGYYIDFSNHPSGVYIIKIDDVNFKITKR